MRNSGVISAADPSAGAGPPAPACPGCGVVLPAVDGPLHPYMTGSAACWERYGELLAAQYADPDRMTFHQLVVDAYAVQHPGGEDPRAIRSVGIHLMTLYLFLERGIDPARGPELHRQMVTRPAFERLDAPSDRGALTVCDVAVTGSAPAAREAAYAWAWAVWRAWSSHHATVHGWLAQSGL
ncbi:MAG: DUF5946 family protein [Solirubrobacteraceae bacterium]